MKSLKIIKFGKVILFLKFLIRYEYVFVAAIRFITVDYEIEKYMNYFLEQ